jgi:hypothetical protein
MEVATMFRKAKKRVIKWPVTVNQPQDGGSVRSCRFEVLFEVKTQSELEAIAKSGQDMLAAIVTGWERYVDEDDKPIDFNADELGALLDDPPTRAALFFAYGEIQGGRAAARKNG